jgi:hypothetical protein
MGFGRALLCGCGSFDRDTPREIRKAREGWVLGCGSLGMADWAGVVLWGLLV